jgi:hypothetical protein
MKRIRTHAFERGATQRKGGDPDTPGGKAPPANVRVPLGEEFRLELPPMPVGGRVEVHVNVVRAGRRRPRVLVFRCE